MAGVVAEGETRSAVWSGDGVACEEGWVGLWGLDTYRIYVLYVYVCVKNCDFPRLVSWTSYLGLGWEGALGMLVIGFGFHFGY